MTSALCPSKNTYVFGSGATKVSLEASKDSSAITKLMFSKTSLWEDLRDLFSSQAGREKRQETRREQRFNNLVSTLTKPLGKDQANTKIFLKNLGITEQSGYRDIMARKSLLKEAFQAEKAGTRPAFLKKIFYSLVALRTRTDKEKFEKHAPILRDALLKKYGNTLPQGKDFTFSDGNRPFIDLINALNNPRTDLSKDLKDTGILPYDFLMTCYNLSKETQKQIRENLKIPSFARQNFQGEIQREKGTEKIEGQKPSMRSNRSSSGTLEGLAFLKEQPTKTESTILELVNQHQRKCPETESESLLEIYNTLVGYTSDAFKKEVATRLNNPNIPVEVEVMYVEAEDGRTNDSVRLFYTLETEPRVTVMTEVLFSELSPDKKLSVTFVHVTPFERDDPETIKNQGQAEIKHKDDVSHATPHKIVSEIITRYQGENPDAKEDDVSAIQTLLTTVTSDTFTKEIAKDAGQPEMTKVKITHTYNVVDQQNPAQDSVTLSYTIEGTREKPPINYEAKIIFSEYLQIEDDTKYQLPLTLVGQDTDEEY